MATKDRQILITQIVSDVLEEKYNPEQTYDWFINQHKPEHFKAYFKNISSIFTSLKGKPELNSIRKLHPDAYFGGKYNMFFEFDEIQHFSTARFYTYKHYPPDLHLNYSITDWQNYCQAHQLKANKYRAKKTTDDFNFIGGRTAQRAYLDCFRDLLPTLHGLNPTLRIAEFEVSNVKFNDEFGRKVIQNILKKKLLHL